ncbi:type II toxin-antitoxin system HicA family toxin [Desulfobacula sp.]|uniref:type II toxin-antitoxin system HicA family toxin n=1 Tax=Desulfobacula sp. TaxID=2593537 RepID=UPI0025C20E9D|nr:type II toxin-antitoxin system HicA family toxin [Desulfobacula sp.]MBC2704257.1 type II toxin-antitoxin system HicA family toxin [Desulfobacula sp.]
MTSYPAITFKNFIQKVQKLGFQRIRQQGSHIRFVHPDGRKTTIPKAIRDSLKINFGDKIEIIVTEKKREAIIRPVSKKVDDLFRKLHKPGRKVVSIETMDDAIRNRMKNKFK